MAVLTESLIYFILSSVDKYRKIIYQSLLIEGLAVSGWARPFPNLADQIGFIRTKTTKQITKINTQ
ncbi:hypothetical protein LC612_42525, partial [Nostoc sp. CHAB 5834]|nr:hypothetical protein [Nostoc sp. CHAB 5834]